MIYDKSKTYTAKKIYEIVEDPDKRWNNKKAQPLTEVYDDILKEFYMNDYYKKKPRVILRLLLEEMYYDSTFKVNPDNGKEWMVEIRFKHPIFILDEDLKKIDKIDEIKEKLKNTKWKEML